MNYIHPANLERSLIARRGSMKYRSIKIKHIPFLVHVLKVGCKYMNIELLCNEYRENKRMIEELTALNEELKNKIVAAMQGKDTLIVGCTKVSNITVNSTRLDSTALKTAYPDIYTAYSKTTAYKRFTVV